MLHGVYMDQQDPEAVPAGRAADAVSAVDAKADEVDSQVPGIIPGEAVEVTIVRLVIQGENHGARAGVEELGEGEVHHGAGECEAAGGYLELVWYALQGVLTVVVLDERSELGVAHIFRDSLGGGCRRGRGGGGGGCELGRGGGGGGPPGSASASGAAGAAGAAHWVGKEE